MLATNDRGFDLACPLQFITDHTPSPRKPLSQSDEYEEGVEWLEEGSSGAEGEDGEEFLDPDGGEAIQQLGTALGERRGSAALACRRSMPAAVPRPD